MAVNVTFVMTGDAEINRMLHELPRGPGRKVIRESARRAIKPLVPGLKRRTPKLTGALSRSVTVRAIKRSRKAIGVRLTTHAGNLFSGKTFYGGFVHWGWETPSGRKVPGREWIKRYAESRRSATLAHYRLLLVSGIEETARRLARGA